MENCHVISARDASFFWFVSKVGKVLSERSPMLPIMSENSDLQSQQQQAKQARRSRAHGLLSHSAKSALLPYPSNHSQTRYNHIAKVETFFIWLDQPTRHQEEGALSQSTIRRSLQAPR
jgi:hypothetical protein